MGAKCASSARKKSFHLKKLENAPKKENQNHSFVNEMPYSEQEKEDENFNPKTSRLRLNHSMHKSSIITINEQTKEIKPADRQVDGNFRFEDIVTITKENIKNIYDVDPKVVGILYK